jgi:outer membrane murein-binding lipoprotein Lpp
MAAVMLFCGGLASCAVSGPVQPRVATNREADSLRISQLEAEVGRLNATVAQLSARLAAAPETEPALMKASVGPSPNPETEEPRDEVAVTPPEGREPALRDPVAGPAAGMMVAAPSSPRPSASALCSARDKALIEDELYRAQRALVRVMDHLELTADAKRALLRGLRPARALDTTNPWVATTD